MALLGLAFLFVTFPSLAQFVDPAVPSTSPEEYVEASFAESKIKMQSREVQYHKNTNELRMLLELHDQSQETRLMAIQATKNRSLKLYDANLNSHEFTGSQGVAICDENSPASCFSRKKYSVFSSSNPIIMVLKFKADNFEATNSVAVSIPIIYWYRNKYKTFDRRVFSLRTMTFRDLPVRTIEQ